VNAEQYTRSRLAVKNLTEVGRTRLTGDENGALAEANVELIGQTTGTARGLTWKPIRSSIRDAAGKCCRLKWSSAVVVMTKSGRANSGFGLMEKL
jgi:hypothetical protein